MNPLKWKIRKVGTKIGWIWEATLYSGDESPMIIDRKMWTSFQVLWNLIWRMIDKERKVQFGMGGR